MVNGNASPRLNRCAVWPFLSFVRRLVSCHLVSLCQRVVRAGVSAKVVMQSRNNLAIRALSYGVNSRSTGGRGGVQHIPLVNILVNYQVLNLYPVVIRASASGIASASGASGLSRLSQCLSLRAKRPFHKTSANARGITGRIPGRSLNGALINRALVPSPPIQFRYGNHYFFFPPPDCTG